MHINRNTVAVRRRSITRCRAQDPDIEPQERPQHSVVDFDRLAISVRSVDKLSCPVRHDGQWCTREVRPIVLASPLLM